MVNNPFPFFTTLIVVLAMVVLFSFVFGKGKEDANSSDQEGSVTGSEDQAETES